MTELTHTDADDAFHEIQLSVKQVVFLFMAATVVGVMIFLLGVWVGRGVPNQRTPESVSTSAAGLPPAGGTPEQASPGASEVTRPPADPPPPAGEDDTDLSYPNLGSEKPPKDRIAPKPEAAKPEPPPPAKAEKPAPAEPASSAAPAGGRPGVWVVQLVALKDRSAAAAVVKRLTAKGYPAFVVSPAAGAPSIYRVQVGRYNDRREAEQVARRLEKEEQFKPWISH